MKMPLFCLAGLVATGASVGMLRVGARSEFAAASHGADVAINIGLDPLKLAASGFDEARVREILDVLEAAETLRAQLRLVREDLDASATRITSLAEQACVEPYSQERASALRQAEWMLESARRLATGVEAGLRDVALENATPEVVARLDKCANASEWRIDEELRVAECTDEQWLLVETTLITERRAARLRTDLPSSVSDVLNDLRSRLEPAHAEQRLATNRGPIEAVFAGQR